MAKNDTPPFKKSQKVSSDDSPVAEVQLSGGLDPHQMPHILEKIFGFCKVKDLNSCRMVSRFWNHNSTKIWRSRVNINFRFGMKSSFMERFKIFLQSKSYENSGFPYRHFKLSQWVYPSDKLWELCGTNIHVLKLCDVGVKLNEFRRLIYTGCPNIKELNLNDVDVQKAFGPKPEFRINRGLKCLRVLNSDNLSNLWLDLLTHFPAVEVLQLKETYSDSRMLIQHIFEAVELVRSKDTNALQLKNIDMPLSDNIAPALVRVLTDPNLPLEKLKIVVNGIDVEFIIRDILLSNAATLKTLNLTRYADEADIDVSRIYPLPGERTLHKLEDISASSSVLTSLSFLRWTPNLKKFDINHITTHDKGTNIIQNTNWDEMNHVAMSKLTELYINEMSDVTSNHLKVLIRCFPNVEKLKMSLNNENFELVCEHWKNLNFLKTAFKDMLDKSEITGYNPQDVNMINFNHDWCLTTDSRRPNITQLQSLRVLYLQNLGPRKTLEHCAAFHGFIRLRILQYLCLSRFEITTAVRNLIKSRVDEFYLSYYF